MDPHSVFKAYDVRGRADIGELGRGCIEPVVSDGGNTIVWEDVPAQLSADGDLADRIAALPTIVHTQVAVRIACYRHRDL